MVFKCWETKNSIQKANSEKPSIEPYVKVGRMKIRDDGPRTDRDGERVSVRGDAPKERRGVRDGRTGQEQRIEEKLQLLIFDID